MKIGENSKNGDHNIGPQIPAISGNRVRATVGDDDSKLIGWLQVRDREQRKKSFLQVTD
jgi:hypothetical protein